MKVKEERDKLESLLNGSPSKISNAVPEDGEVAAELQTEPTIDVDFDDLKTQCDNEARKMILASVEFILSDTMILENPYIGKKLEVDVESLGGMIYQLRSNETMQKALMEEVKKGMMHPRMFEVFGQLSKTIAELNKQTLSTVEAIKSTYKDLKIDIRENETEAIGPGQSNSSTMIGQGNSVVTLGTKDLIKSSKANKNSHLIPESNISDAKIEE